MTGHPAPTRAGRILAQRVAEANRRPDIQRARIGTAAIRLHDALEQLRAAWLTEADNEGEWTQAIYETQEKIREAIASCHAMLSGMEEK